MGRVVGLTVGSIISLAVRAGALSGYYVARGICRVLCSIHVYCKQTACLWWFSVLVELIIFYFDVNISEHNPNVPEPKKNLPMALLSSNNPECKLIQYIIVWRKLFLRFTGHMKSNLMAIKIHKLNTWVTIQQLCNLSSQVLQSCRCAYCSWGQESSSVSHAGLGGATPQNVHHSRYHCTLHLFKACTLHPLLVC